MGVLRRNLFVQTISECFENLIQNEGFKIKKERSDEHRIFLENGQCGIIVSRDQFYKNHFIDFYDPNLGLEKEYQYPYVVKKLYPEVTFIHGKKKEDNESVNYFEKTLKGNSKFIEEYLKMIIHGDFSDLKEFD